MADSDRKKRDEQHAAIFAHLQQHGILRKDRAEPLESKPGTPRSRREQKRHRLVVDLHGLRTDDALRQLKRAIEQGMATGMREVLVIHGVGLHSNPTEGPVLKQAVRDLLENEFYNQVRSYRGAVPRDGGDGATLIALH